MIPMPETQRELLPGSEGTKKPDRPSELVTRRGEYVGIQNHPNVITLGILASNPKLLLPDLMIVAWEKENETSKELQISRLIPLSLVDIFVHDLSERRLKLHLVTGQKYYLQLSAPEDEEDFLFERWISLIYLLRVASGKISTPVSMTPRGSAPRADAKQHWLPAVMVQDFQQLKQHPSQASSSYENQTFTPSISIASRQSILKPGSGGCSSQGTLGLSTNEPEQQYTSSEKTQASRPKKQSKSKRASARSPTRSCVSTGVGTSEHSTLSVGVGPSLPSTVSRAAGPSKPGSQLSAGGSSQRRDVGHASVSKVKKDPSVKTPEESEPTAVKLERSQKFLSLVQAQSLLPKDSQDLREKRTTESQNRTAGRSNPRRPPSREGSASHSMSREQSHRVAKADSPRAPLATSAQRSVAVGPSDVYDSSVASEPSAAGPMLVAAGPSGATSVGTKGSDVKTKPSEAVKEVEKGAAETGDRLLSRELSVKSKASEKYGTSAAPPKPETRPTSLSPTPEGQRSRSWSPKRKSSRGSKFHKTTVSAAMGPSQPGLRTVAVGPSKMVSPAQTRSQSRTSEADKRSKPKARPGREKRGEPSSALDKKESTGDQATTSRSKLKSAMSSAKKRSSLTFVTIYSALSSSMERLKDSKNKDEAKFVLQDEITDVSSKSSKHVTISGVIGPSGRNFLPHELRDSSELSGAGMSGMDAGSKTGAMLGTEAENQPIQTLTAARGSEANATAVNARPSNRGDTSGAAGQSQKHSRPPDRSRISVRAGPSQKLSTQDPKDPSVKSRISEGAGGPSAIETKSVAMGRSGRITVSEAPGPSMQRLKTAEFEELTTRAQQQSREAHTESGAVSHKSKFSKISGLLAKSRISVGVGRSLINTVSKAVGFSKTSNTQKPSLLKSGGWLTNVKKKDKSEGKRKSPQKSRAADASPRPSNRPSRAVTRPPSQSGSLSPEDTSARADSDVPWPPERWSHSSYPMFLKLKNS
ncbi:Golgi-associated RAB2 interactor protein 5B isoform X2 [Hemicordylus capensis]|uniref:Golgi-associated RAB2 interactor protein 5B isoform X2 n=1 Tax=Hemicordylus capensis TaxID=884348 RepID=UPI002302F1DD|nr:Golgi-associated RAB2 interactor protein 5B isoform X2 [Hemicordylus capensis]